jgi:phosphatidylglycerol:prolipoprotein diacylglycerol transferase
VSPPVDPILFEAGPLAVRWYGLLIMAAVLTGTFVASSWVARRGENPYDLWDMLAWVLIPAFIGARLYYVFVQSPRGEEGLERYLGEYISRPGEILAVWSGGLHIFGGFLFGGLALFLFTRWRRLPALVFLDGVALGLPLGQAIGRWGNFINQELYGPPTRLPWGLRIDEDHRIGEYADLGRYPVETVRFHPLFLYESLWNLLGFGIIFALSRRFEDRLRPGDVLLMYLIWYPMGRFFLEFFREDSWFFPGTPFNVVHVLCLAAVVVSTFLLVTRHRTASPKAPS